MASILVYGIQIFLNNTVYSLGLKTLNIIIQMPSVFKFILKLTTGTLFDDTSIVVNFSLLWTEYEIQFRRTD